MRQPGEELSRQSNIVQIRPRDFPRLEPVVEQAWRTCNRRAPSARRKSERYATQAQTTDLAVASLLSALLAR
jgi:hypothetical protein